MATTPLFRLGSWFNHSHKASKRSGVALSMKCSVWNASYSTRSHFRHFPQIAHRMCQSRPTCFIASTYRLVTSRLRPELVERSAPSLELSEHGLVKLTGVISTSAVVVDA